MDRQIFSRSFNACVGIGRDEYQGFEKFMLINLTLGWVAMLAWNAKYMPIFHWDIWTLCSGPPQIAIGTSCLEVK
jgi:hypothetical protein